MAAAHDLIEDFDGEHTVAFVIEDDEVPNFNGVSAG
jgi:hypothetical protein